MPEDVGGSPFPDGWEPDDDHDRGGADEEFASVVFDEDFVRSAEIHEPTAVERLLAAAEARAEAEHRLRGRRTPADDDESYDPEDGPDGFDGYGPRRRGRPGARGHDAYDGAAFGHDREFHEAYDPAGTHGAYGPYGPYDPEFLQDGYGRRGHTRWHRPVAWLLAVVMGIGMVALAFTAVYRGASSGRQDRVPPPATTGVDPTSGADPARGAGATANPGAESGAGSGTDSGSAPSASADYSAPPVPAQPPPP